MNEHSGNATTRRAFPGQLFYTTQIPVCLWFLAENKSADATAELRDCMRWEKKSALTP